MLAVDALVPSAGIADDVRAIVVSIDFAHTVLNGMLSILLFAGALHTDLSQLKSKVVPIATLASVGVLISTSLAGAGAYYVFQFFGVPVPLVWCLVFGALISSFSLPASVRKAGSDSICANAVCRALARSVGTPGGAT